MSKKTKNIKKSSATEDSINDTGLDTNGLTIEEQFTRKTQHQHALDAPGMYIGPTHQDTATMYVYDDNINGIIHSKINVVLGLYKIFDEILVNAADNTVRDKKCNRIDVNMDTSSGIIEVKNNGSTIPIEFHKDEQMYVPQMIFGTLLTSGNYDKKGKVVGGQNGLGAKLTSIYSKWFDVEIQDVSRHKKYYQRFKNNMFELDEPVITSISKNITESYTKIRFFPDYARFGLQGLTEDMYSLLKRRVYDIAGTTNSSVKVFFNEELLDIKTFEDYIKLYYSEVDEEDLNLVYQDFNDRWSVGVVYDPTNEFKHMTFVNKISTYDGGTHLNYIVGQIVDKVTHHIISQPKYKTLKIKPAQIKENITVFINSTIEDPMFGSQTKDMLKTKMSDFKVKCDLDDNFIKRICKSGLLDEIIQTAQIKQLAELEKTDGKKVSNLKKLVKLEDARFAGSKQAHKCTLILTEGDSAKSFAISGLELIGRDYFGVFPLKGKLLNVREATANQLLNNEEIKNLKQIIGLKQNKVYKSTNELRYGHILILTDQDMDGSHIKGLIMNFIHTFWPSLAKIDGFIQSIATPIVKVSKKSDEKKKSDKPPKLIFYTIAEYKKWCESVSDIKNYEIKYYKGLGTSDNKEAKESFVDYENKIINYVWNTNTNVKSNVKANKKKIEDEQNEQNEQDDTKSVSTSSDKTDIIDKSESSYQAITLAFAKNRANDRKEWLKQYDPDKIIENANKQITYDDFIEYDLKHFSNSDNVRSIPDIADGLKPSQRKILFGAFKRKLYELVKVAQLSGYISEHTGYHHGEASLQGAIINMAQNYVGSNNLNVFHPKGNFGSRRMGGEDAASPRYIETKLNKFTKIVFNKRDDSVLKYKMEESNSVEPEVYYPIIPMILVNGSRGIGTGYSTFVPQYNPKDLVSNIVKYLSGTPMEKLDELTPWYKGFTGVIEKKQKLKPSDKESYNIYGVVTIINENKVRVKELPIGVWTENYLQFLSNQMEDGDFIVDYINNSTNNKVDIEIIFSNGRLQQLLKSDTLYSKLKLINSMSIQNMHLYKNNVITKYKSANAILEDYIQLRLQAYTERKINFVKILSNEMKVLKYRKKFIEQILEKEIIIERKKKVEIINQLVEQEYPQLAINLGSVESYDYLVNLPLFSLTMEKIDEINAEYKAKKDELDNYKNTTVESLWLEELKEFEQVYDEWLKTEEDPDDKVKPSSKKSSSSKITKAVKTTKTTKTTKTSNI